jgi:outer membrane receptor protein involved in Fe transport
LILLNGRRVVGSPSLGGGGTVNLNMIPFSAVDRIEVIADGASAIYGSDAIAGVVNVILKKNYDGMRFSARYGDRENDDGSETGFSMMTGASNDRGSVTMGLEWDTRDPIFDADRDFTTATSRAMRRPWERPSTDTPCSTRTMTTLSRSIRTTRLRGKYRLATTVRLPRKVAKRLTADSSVL